MTSFEERYERLTPAQRELFDAWLADDGVPEPTPPPHEPPTTATERLLAEIWAEVLDLPRVGRTDDYFSVGGDSIRAIVVVAKARAAGLSISTQDLFEERTIQRLAAVAQPTVHIGQPIPPLSSASPSDSCHVAGDRDGAVHPLAPMQEGMLFHALAADRPVYTVQVTCELVGDIDVADLHAAWDAVLRRHEALRCTFVWSAQAPPHQITRPAAMPQPHVEDLRGLDDDRQRRHVRDYLTADLARGFDLGSAPLLRIALFRTSPTAYQVVWTHHHLLLDGWSQQLVLADVLHAYASIRAGRSPDVPLRRSNIDYALTPTDDEQREADAFWREHLHGFTDAVALPRTGFAASPAATAVHALSSQARADVEAMCREHALTLATVVQLGWALVLARLTGRTDVVVGTTVSGRSAAREGITEAVGMFINTIPVRVRWRPGATVAEVLAQVHRRQLAASRYELTALPRIARCAQIAPGATLFESIVVVENFPSQLNGIGTEATVRIEGPETFVDEGYPIVVEVTPALQIRARYDTARFGAVGADDLMRLLCELLAMMPVSTRLRPDELLAKLDATVGEDEARERDELHAHRAELLRGSRREPVRLDGA